ncbi:MAG: hypothetical protein GWN87_27065, partial [Desulfuromonadales bacterium]|nr:hypothetical protein [Desulfuromonadales bacterium]
DETIFDQDLGKPQGEEIGITMAADREFFVSCQIATSDDSPGSNAHELMETAERALRLPSTREAFRVAGLAIVESEPIRDLDEVAGQQYISRAVMDVRFRLLAGVTERTGYIAKVGVHGTIKDVDGSTALDYSEDIQI